MKKGILLAVVIFLSTAVFAHAQEGELSGSIDLTYMSQYIWRGFPLFGEKSAIRSSIDLDLYDTGLGLNVMWIRANSSGYENAEKIELTLSYSGNLFEYETYATDYTVGWMYYNYPDQPTDGTINAPSIYRQEGNSDLQEFFASFSWPEICTAGVVPSYTIIRMWASESGSAISRGLSRAGAGGFGGWLHVLGLGYDLPMEDLLPDLPEQILHLYTSTTYNDGVLGVDNDWSHMLFGASTDFDLGNDLTLTPGVYYQSSWEDDVNDDDELWCSLGLRYAF